MRSSYGAVRLARDTGAPIIPFTWSTRRKTVVHKSWDKHCLPSYFTKGVIVWGDPIYVPAEASQDELEAARLEVEQVMNRITREADEAAGGAIIEPDPAPRPQKGADGMPV